MFGSDEKKVKESRRGSQDEVRSERRRQGPEMEWEVHWCMGGEPEEAVVKGVLAAVAGHE